MAGPVVQKTWTITANNTITYVSLTDTMGNLLKGVLDFLLAHGYSLKGSSDATTADMSGGNYWGTAADASHRGGTTATSQSWAVVTDGQGVDICIAYEGAVDYGARISFSPGGNYALNGTDATYTPTAVDEVLFGAGGVNLIGTSTTLDRYWYAWVDSNAELFRVVCQRDGTAEALWGVEAIDPLLTQTYTVPVWGFHITGSSFDSGGSYMASGTTQGQTWLLESVAKNIGAGFYHFSGLPCGQAWPTTMTELQGGAAYPMFGPPTLACGLTGSKGVVGYMYDWFTGYASGQCNGRLYNSSAYIQMGAIGTVYGMVWPWDGATVPVTGRAIPGAVTGVGVANPDQEASYASVANMAISDYNTLAANTVDPIGPSAVKSIARRGGVEVLRLIPRSDDPPAETDRVLFYSRIIDGGHALFSRYPDGSIVEVGYSL